MEAFLDFDLSVFKWIEENIWCPVLDTLMPLITHLGDSGLVWIVAAIALLVTKKYRRAGATVAVALLLSLLFTNLLLKDIIARPRPFTEFEILDVGMIAHPSGWSFPSGHASSSFAAAAALVFSSKKRLYIPAIVLAVLISFSRIYVHVHYCTDVLAGMLLGIVYGVAAGLLIMLLSPKIQKKFDDFRHKKASSAATHT